MTNTQQVQQIISLRQAIIKISDEINNASEDEYSIDGNIPVLEASDSNNHEMAAYNSSNRLPNHQTRWNSH